MYFSVFTNHQDVNVNTVHTAMTVLFCNPESCKVPLPVLSAVSESFEFPLFMIPSAPRTLVIPDLMSLKPLSSSVNVFSDFARVSVIVNAES